MLLPSLTQGPPADQSKNLLLPLPCLLARGQARKWEPRACEGLNPPQRRHKLNLEKPPPQGCQFGGYRLWLSTCDNRELDFKATKNTS